VITPDHFLGTLDKLVFEDIEALLELAQTKVYFRFFLGKLGVLVNL
jgi:hypothetical protein